MLIFILLFSMSRILQGAPAMPSSSFTCAGDTLSLIARGDQPTSDGDGQNIRNRFSIVQSCLLTIFACVWTAIHPNINGPMDSGWTRLKRKVTTTLVALIAPELILNWAVEQRMSAKMIVDKYNKEFATCDSESKGLRKKLIDYFKHLPKSATHQGNGQPWTMTHGFFIQMGGFLLCDKGYPIEVLDFARLSQLLREKIIDQPTVTERELQDRSKGDAISKGIVVWQTMWFALQCCARMAQHLPLSELEVVTLAFTVVNVVIYVAWWDKPQSVDTAIRLQLKELGDGNDTGSTDTAITLDKATEDNTENNSDFEHQPAKLVHSTDSVNSARSQKPTDESTSEVRPSTANSDDSLPDISDLRPLMPEEKPDEEERWLRRKLRKDHQNHGLPVFLIFRLPYRVVASGWHYTFDKVGQPGGFDGKRLRVPMLYAARNSSFTAGYSLAVIGFIFGAIHFLAWAAEFSSRLDQVLWRCAAIALVGFPSFTFFLLVIDSVESHSKSKVKEALDVLIEYGLILPSVILYIPARLVVIILALKAIRDPSPVILQDVSWTSFVPHL